MGLPLNWRTQFAIALITTTALWFVTVYWAHSNDQGVTVVGITWLVFKHLFVPLLSLASLVWVFLLLFKQRFFLNQWVQLTNSQQARFSAVYVGVMLISLVAYVVAHARHSSVAPQIISDIELPIFVVWVAAFCWVAQKNSTRPPEAAGRGASETTTPQRAVFNFWQKRELREAVISVFAFIAVFIPLRSAESSIISGLMFLAAMQFMWSRRFSEFFLNRGAYQLALFFAAMQIWAPKQARQLKGWILVEAGQFARATTFLRSLAYGDDGNPRLQDWSYYLFATALMDDGQESAAQDLFEAALQVPQTNMNIHFGLADCLLSQGIDPRRAMNLAKECFAQDWDLYTVAQKRLVKSQCVALQAWAMAILGDSIESKKLLEKAFAESEQMQKRDLAALTHLEGVTLTALGNIADARLAFERVLALFPHGAVMIRARMGLAELGDAANS